MEFTRTAVLSSTDGVYAREKKTKDAKSIGTFDYFRQKDSFVSEETVRLKNIHAAEVEERKAVQDRRISRAVSRANDMESPDSDDDAVQEYGPASITINEFDFLEAQSKRRRQREKEDEKDIAEFLNQKNAVGNRIQRTPSTAILEAQRRQKRPSTATPSSSAAAKATIKIRKRGVGRAANGFGALVEQPCINQRHNRGPGPSGDIYDHSSSTPGSPPIGDDMRSGRGLSDSAVARPTNSPCDVGVVSGSSAPRRCRTSEWCTSHVTQNYERNSEELDLLQWESLWDTFQEDGVKQVVLNK